MCLDECLFDCPPIVVFNDRFLRALPSIRPFIKVYDPFRCRRTGGMNEERIENNRAGRFRKMTWSNAYSKAIGS